MWRKASAKAIGLLYVQADEVIHEKDHLTIKSACQTFITDLKIDGFALDFIHFWGDYEHYVNGHGWYKSEVRIIRNDAEIHSWKSAQSFRRIPNFDGIDYRQTKGVTKLNVVKTQGPSFSLRICKTSFYHDFKEKVARYHTSRTDSSKFKSRKFDSGV